MMVKVYKIKIGLEIHIQLNTKNKMFCFCLNQFGKIANSLICPICTAHPGTLPILNREVVERAIIAGLLCNCEISKLSRFDRKSYFYPDMPKNYQITQYNLPICKNGSLYISGRSIHGNLIQSKSIRINRIHLEEDVAKVNYINKKVWIDYNRAGIPLIEIVTEPDISSADEAYVYLTTLKKIMKHADISNCEMEKAQIRCDVNISLNLIDKSDNIIPGVKIEIKNLNSFKSVYKSILYEIERETNILNYNNILEQTTMGWDDNKNETYIMRKKETTNEYRYFPEPDLLPLVITDDMIELIKNKMLETTETKKYRFITKYNLTEYDAHILISNRNLANYFDNTAKFTSSTKILANWIINNLLKEINKHKINIINIKIVPRDMAELINLICKKILNIQTAKNIFRIMFDTGKSPNIIMKTMNMVQIIDDNKIENIVDEILNDNCKLVKEFFNGNISILQYLIGQIMKKSNGSISPNNVIKVLKMKLDILKSTFINELNVKK